MLGIKDIRKSRFYQEAKQDGRDELQEEMEALRRQSLERTLFAVRELAAGGMPAKRIAKTLSLDVDQVQEELAKLSRPNDESAE